MKAPDLILILFCTALYSVYAIHIRLANKLIDFWREEYKKEKEYNYVLARYCLSEIVKKYVEKEDFEKAKEALDLLNKIKSPTSQTD